nr:hypothetical protein Iba_chr13bCG15000 [Ipomoea batatas]
MAESRIRVWIRFHDDIKNFPVNLPVTVNELPSYKHIADSEVRRPHIKGKTDSPRHSLNHLMNGLFFSKISCHTIPLYSVEAHHIKPRLKTLDKSNKAWMLNHMQWVVVHDGHPRNLLAATIRVKSDERCAIWVIIQLITKDCCTGAFGNVAFEMTSASYFTALAQALLHPLPTASIVKNSQTIDFFFLRFLGCISEPLSGVPKLFSCISIGTISLLSIISSDKLPHNPLVQCLSSPYQTDVEDSGRKQQSLDAQPCALGFVEGCHGVHTANCVSLMMDGLDGVIHQLSSVRSRVDAFLCPAADAVSHADRLRLRKDKVRVFSERLRRIVFGYIERVGDHFGCAPLGQPLVLSGLERNPSTRL